MPFYAFQHNLANRLSRFVIHGKGKDLVRPQHLSARSQSSHLNNPFLPACKIPSRLFLAHEHKITFATSLTESVFGMLASGVPATSVTFGTCTNLVQTLGLNLGERRDHMLCSISSTLNGCSHKSILKLLTESMKIYQRAKLSMEIISPIFAWE